MSDKVLPKSQAEHKIIVCTTFRDFDDSENSRIQELFLESVRKQTNDNYCLVVTVFREKNVKPVLSSMFGEKCSFFDEHLEGYKYSLSPVFIHGIEESKKYANSIVLWCTCDIILPENFFEVIVNLYSDDLVGTSHPNAEAGNIRDFHEGKIVFEPYYHGIDLLFFAASLLQKEQTMSILKKYYFYEWGIWEFFLVGIGLMNSNRLINLLGLCDIRKIENDRIAANESSSFLMESNKRNLETLKQCINETGMDARVEDSFYCHKKFKLLVFPYKFYLSMGFIRSLKAELRRAATRLPRPIKHVIKRMLRLV